MTTFCTVNWRNYEGRGVEYCNILFDSIRRNLKEGTEGTFVVFTDDVSDGQGYADGIELRKLPDGLEGWFNKLYCFSPAAIESGERVVLFDLDTVITGSLDELAAYRGMFAILRDAYRPAGLQSSVMAWPAGCMDFVWNAYVSDGFPRPAGGDQTYIESLVKQPFILQGLFPNAFVSYKRDARFGIPPKASAVFFHGRPRPHEVTDGWVPHVWKVGGCTSAQLELVGNTDADAIKANILRAEAIPDATWLMPCKPHDKVALICAGGPSLNDEIISVAVHAQNGAHVFACNNVPARLRANGIRTDFHVIVDARPENAAFSRDLGEHTLCLYASQCDEAVHSAGGGNLALWHPAIEGMDHLASNSAPRAFIGGGTTCGMKTATIAWTLGYREIHLYGFDSCYRGTEHHAYPQSLNDHEQVLDVEYDGKHYKCAPWMIQQAEDFETFGPQLLDHGVRLHVHGSGLIPDIANNFSRGVFRPEAADFRALAILERLQPVSDPRVAEVGVFAGDLSRRLLARRPDLELLMVDSWSNTSDGYKDSQDYHSKLSAEAQQQFFRLACDVTAFATGRRTILRMDSKDAARAIPDNSLDLAFIDADHSYEGCKSDLEAYWPKVKPGGFLSGHDYANDDWKFGPMVKRAVDEFASAKGLTVDLGENWTYFMNKPLEAAE